VVLRLILEEQLEFDFRGIDASSVIQKFQGYFPDRIKTRGFVTVDRSQSSWSIAIQPNIAIANFEEAVQTSMRNSTTMQKLQ